MRVAAFALLFVARLGAQQPSPPWPAPIIQIYREEIRLGKADAYHAVETAAADTCRRAPCPNHYVTIESITGRPEVWFITSYASYAAMQQVFTMYGRVPALMAALSRVVASKVDLATEARTIFAEYRPALSRVNGTMSVPAWLVITTTSGRPPEPTDTGAVAVYQVVAGAASDTYLALRPATSIVEAGALLGRAGNGETEIFAFAPAMSF